MELFHRWCCAILDTVVLFVDRFDMRWHVLSAAEDNEENTTAAEDIEDNIATAEDIEDNTTTAEVTHECVTVSKLLLYHGTLPSPPGDGSQQ